MQREVEQCKVPNPIQTRGTTHTQHSRHSTGPQGKRKGDANIQTGDANIRRGGQQHSRPSLTMPPTIRYATPPSTMATPSTTVRGE